MTPTAFVFVRVVAAVVVVVALPAAGHAAVVPTPELVRLACPLSCVDKRCMKTKKVRLHPRLNVNVSYRTPLLAHLMHRRSRPRRRTSSGRECNARSLYSGTRPRRTSSGLEGGRQTGGRAVTSEGLGRLDNGKR